MLRGWTFIDPAYVGVPLAVVGILALMFFGTKLLPDNKNIKPVSDDEDEDPAKLVKESRLYMISSGRVRCS